MCVYDVSPKSLCVFVYVCAAVYEEHGCTLMPWAAWACRSMAWAGCCPGRAFISVRFLTQPFIPDENFPPVMAVIPGAPPVARNHTHIGNFIDLQILKKSMSETDSEKLFPL